MMPRKAKHLIDFNQFVWGLPRPARLSNSNQLYDCAADAVIAIAGFEPRCCEAIRRLSLLDYKTKKSFCIHYKHSEMAEYNELHTTELHELLGSISSEKDTNKIWHNIKEMNTDFGDVLIKALESNGIDLSDNNTKIIYDISVGSSRLLLESLHALFNTNADLTIIYAESTDYKPYFDEYLHHNDVQGSLAPEFLSIGIDDVQVIKRFAGIVSDSRPTYMVVFPSFSPIRIMAVIDEMSPNRIFWLFGIPHLVKNRWRIDAQKKYHKDLLADELHRTCYISTFDYRETLDVLESIYKKTRGTYSIMICTLGSKLQKIGQVLFHMLRPEVGAVASIPRMWKPEKYSSEKAREVYQIKFGPCDRLRKNLIKTKLFQM